MKFEEMLHIAGKLPCFDLATLVQLTGERRESVVQQLYRFSKAEKIIQLRRGLYTLADSFRTIPKNGPELASLIYRPSYLSDVWALSWYQMIPEQAFTYTSVTTRKPRYFENPLGRFAYKNIKQSLFFGYSATEIAGRKVMLATPEKALVDFWYHSPGEWTRERMREMRFSFIDWFDYELLTEIIKKVNKPRLYRAHEIFQELKIIDEAEWQEIGIAGVEDEVA